MDDPNAAVAGELARKTYTPVTLNVVETISAATGFSNFVDAIKTSGVTASLAARGPFTVFAPADEAFKKLPPGSLPALLRNPTRLAAIVNYHVIPGYFDLKELRSGEIKTLQGTALTAVTGGGEATVNGARVVRADLAATNGIVHAIDTLILPKKWRLVPDAA